MNRRQFVAGMAGAAALGMTGTLYAASPASPRLLFVFLRGGYDSNSLLVPYASEDYHALRPHIAIPRPALENTSGALALDSQWALAPALRDTLAPLYQRGQLAFIPFAGTTNTSRSHFATQDDIERGLPQGARLRDSGFLGRLSQELGGKQAIAFSPALPLACRGDRRIPNIALARPHKAIFNKDQSAALLSLYEGDPLFSAVQEGLEFRQAVSRELAEEMMQASRNAVSTRNFEGQAEKMALMMRDSYRLGFVDVGGWDTHVAQGGADGPLARRLAELGRGLLRYAQALGDEWNNTVVVVASEFGRTFRENGNKGTDHGHGTVYWVLGGGIRGGRIVGEQVEVGVASLFQGRDYPVLNNYRALLAGLAQPMWGLSSAAMARVFPGAGRHSFGLV